MKGARGPGSLLEISRLMPVMLSGPTALGAVVVGGPDFRVVVVVNSNFVRRNFCLSLFAFCLLPFAPLRAANIVMIHLEIQSLCGATWVYPVRCKNVSTD